MDPQIRVGVDVGGTTHRVAIADSAGRIRAEFTIPHSQEGFREFFSRIEGERRARDVPVVGL